MNRTFDSVAVGEALPPLTVRVTPTRVIMGASASRDWQPQHHDRDFARKQAGTRDIFMNTPTQMGWICRYLTDWSGPAGRVGRLSFRMRQAICSGDQLTIEGQVKDLQQDAAGLSWARIELTLRTEQGLATRCTARVALPAAEGATSPWLQDGGWQP